MEDLERRSTVTTEELRRLREKEAKWEADKRKLLVSWTYEMSKQKNIDYLFYEVLTSQYPTVLSWIVRYNSVSESDLSVLTVLSVTVKSIFP